MHLCQDTVVPLSFLKIENMMRNQDCITTGQGIMDAKVGRFVSEDPIGFAGGINFYSYVGNSPNK